jgi:HEAT repeat protein
MEMDVEQEQTLISQLPLFQIGDTSSELVELFPSVWSAAENLANPEVAQRYQAVEFLFKTRAVRISPLIVYLMVTRITDPDLEVRKQVVNALSSIYVLDDKGNPTPEIVRRHLEAQLANMHTREIYSLLQVLVAYPEQTSKVARLFNACPYAGNHLSDVMASRKTPQEIRRQAIRLIGQVGYLDAIPTLERIAARLESRLNGQQAMPFAPPTGVDDTNLLPDIKASLALLRSP